MGLAPGVSVFLDGVRQNEPDAAQVHAALAEAWSLLGYDSKAQEAARRAYELSEGLPRETRRKNVTQIASLAWADRR